MGNRSHRLCSPDYISEKRWPTLRAGRVLSGLFSHRGALFFFPVSRGGRKEAFSLSLGILCCSRSVFFRVNFQRSGTFIVNRNDMDGVAVADALGLRIESYLLLILVCLVWWASCLNIFGILLARRWRELASWKCLTFCMGIFTLDMGTFIMESKYITWCFFDQPGSWVSCHSRKHRWEYLQGCLYHVPFGKLQMGPQRLSSPKCTLHSWNLVHFKHHMCQSVCKQSSWRTFANSFDLEKETSLPAEQDDLLNLENSSQKLLSEPPDSDVLKSLLADSERTKLIRKLSEANQYNRFLKRQLQFKEDALSDFKRELAAMEVELQTLIGLAEEIAKSDSLLGLRKINGKYIPSYLLSRLEAVHESIKEQVKGVEAIKLKDIELFWYGMAETVQVMGSFDRWSQGEHMSSEYSGQFPKFSTTLKLRPGHYEIKFLVDGEWQLSPELPVIGEGMLQNNLLVVE